MGYCIAFTYMRNGAIAQNEAEGYNFALSRVTDT